MTDSGFVMWGCGHAHQEEPDGRVITCEPRPVWFIIECVDGSEYATSRGLQAGDYTLHDRHTTDGTFSPAISVSDPFALEVADRAGRRLMIYSRERQQWIPVMA